MTITRGFGDKKKKVNRKDMDRIVDYVVAAIKKELTKRDWKQKDLAERIGKTETWLSRKIGEDIKTKRRITIDDLHIIAKGLGMFATDFFPKRLEDEICSLPLTEFIRNVCRNEIKHYLKENGIITIE